jgi:hypothetical protein
MTTIIVVETHNTDRPEDAWIRGAVRVPHGDRLLQRNGSKNVAEFIIESSSVDPDGRRRFKLNETERWFADDSAEFSARTSTSPSPGSTSHAKHGASTAASTSSRDVSRYARCREEASLMAKG